jgi:hypothetical protein
MSDPTEPKPQTGGAKDAPVNERTFREAASAAQVDERFFYQLVDRMLTEQPTTGEKPELTN